MFSLGFIDEVVDILENNLVGNLELDEKGI